MDISLPGKHIGEKARKNLATSRNIENSRMRKLIKVNLLSDSWFLLPGSRFLLFRFPLRTVQAVAKWIEFQHVQFKQ